LVKSARNPPEIGSPPEIFFACQTTFKSARIFQIWRRKPPSGNAAFLLVILAIDGGFFTDNRRTEKLLCALASGRIWILPPHYLEAALGDGTGHWPDERRFDLGRLRRSQELYIPEFNERQGGAFKGWNVAVPIKDSDLRKKLSNILTRGGATVHAWTLQHLVDEKGRCLR
jgi:hypothetical protein